MNTVVWTLTALAALAVLGAVVLIVMGRGGRMAPFEADHPPLELPAERPARRSDFAAIRLPITIWGYHVRAVDELLLRVVETIAERDERIADLERRLAELGGTSGGDASRRPAETADTGGPLAVTRTDRAGRDGEPARVREAAEREDPAVEPDPHRSA